MFFKNKGFSSGVLKRFLVVSLSGLFLTYCGGGGGGSSSDPATTTSSTTASTTTSTTASTSTSTSTSSSAVSKSTAQKTVVGKLSLSSSASLVGSNLTAPTTLKCTDAADGSVYDQAVAVGSDGSFTCKNVPQCYNASSCAKANPVQVNIIDESSGNVICVASAGATGLVCDTAGCFAAAQAALKDDVKACLTSVNMVAASNVFQNAINKAYAMGQIPLDRYTLESCLAMSSEQKLAALSSMTKGSLAEVLIDSLDAQLQKEIHKCDAKGGEAVSMKGMLRDLLTMGFEIVLNGSAYDADKVVLGSLAAQLSDIESQIKQIKIKVAAGGDPVDLVTAKTIDEDTLKYQLTVKCMYGVDDPASQEIDLNADKTDFAECPATIVKSHGENSSETLSYIGRSIGTKINFPDINDPQGIHSDDGGKGIPFQYEAFKKAYANAELGLSLKDIYEIFFTEASGLKFRLRAEGWDQDAQEHKTYVIDAAGNPTLVASRNDMSAYTDNAYAPSFDRVFNFLTNENYPFDLDKMISTKVHRNWNPTGQEYFYVSGKVVSNKEVPVTCDILDAQGQAVGLNIASGVQVNCTVTSDASLMKRYFVDTASNNAFLRIINKNNGQEVRSADNSPVFLQNINESPGQNMPTCTVANQLSIFEYQKSGDYDKWLDGNTVKTICFDFSTIKNDAEYFAKYSKEATVGNNSWSTSLVAGKKADGSINPVCIATSSISVSAQTGCFNQNTGAFSVCSSVSSCSCDWQNGESMRDFSVMTAPSDGSIALTDCGSSSYYLGFHWEPGSRTSLANLKAQIINSSTGYNLQARNPSYDPSIVSLYIDSAFTECKASKWCWRKEDIKDLAAASDISSDMSWIKKDIVGFYCGQHQDDAAIRSNCDKLWESVPVTLAFSKFSNGSNAASSGVYEIYDNSSYFSHMQQPNPNYNKVFDFETFTFKYANYDPFCDDINADGSCSFVAGAQGNDVYFSDIWNYNSIYAKLSPVDGIAGFTYDANNILFPSQIPTTWDQNTWTTYVNPVFNKIGGPSALACSNDRSKKLSWKDMSFSDQDTWVSTRQDVCGNSSAYFVVRNIIPNKNTYLLSYPDKIMALMRMAFGTLDKRSIDPEDKRFDFIQAMSIFMLSMEIPPIVISENGSYQPFSPVINGKTRDDSWAGYGPTNYSGSLVELADLIILRGK